MPIKICGQHFHWKKVTNLPIILERKLNFHFAGGEGNDSWIGKRGSILIPDNVVFSILRKLPISRMSNKVNWAIFFFFSFPPLKKCQTVIKKIRHIFLKDQLLIMIFLSHYAIFDANYETDCSKNDYIFRMIWQYECMLFISNFFRRVPFFLTL